MNIEPGQTHNTFTSPEQKQPIFKLEGMKIENKIETPPAPIVNVTNQVNPTPVTIENNVKASDVVVTPSPSKTVRILRDENDQMTGAEVE